MSRTKQLSPSEEIALIESKLGYQTFEKPVSSFDYIDLGDKDLNEVLGHREKGIRVGCIIELFGLESHGKTALATIIASVAQRLNPKHVYIAKIDLEATNNDEFNSRMGIALDHFYLFKAKIAASAKAVKRLKKIQEKLEQVKTKEAKEKLIEQYKKVSARAEKFQETAQQVCKKVERWIKFKRDQDPKAVIILIVDSVSSMLVEEEMEADIDNQNMRTNVSLATFLSKLLRRWATFVQNYNVVGTFINQIRTAPGVMFGNPEYTSGGKALKFYSSVRAKISRVSGGRIKKNGRVIGINTIITNHKNKVGGSEGHQCGLKIYTRKGKWKVRDPKQIKKEAKVEKHGED